MPATSTALYASQIYSLPLLSRGKVRDIYVLDQQHLLIVTTDRLSAFDVVLDDPIPGKGAVLNALSNFWFERFAHLPNHFTGIAPETVVGRDEVDQVVGRAVVAKRLRPILVEAVVRGYLSGSGWKDYQRTQSVCGIALPAGLRLADRLPEPLFTPSTKADIGAHDENIDFDRMSKMIGPDLAKQVRDTALDLYAQACDYAAARGIIIADTKFEFGLDESGKLHLIDEVLTPDSSRFWPADAYQPGISPPSFDKQFVRDWLEAQDWNKAAPAPRLPTTILTQTSAKYQEALTRLTT